MLNEKRIETTPLTALIAVNLIYLFLVIINSVEGIYGLWIAAVFLAFLPLILKDKKYTIAVIVFLIPLEISKRYIPFFQSVEVSDGFNSVFDLARLFMLYSFIVWFLTELRSFVPLIKHRISYVIMIFIAYYFLSALFISPDTAKGLTETLRYTIYFLFFTMTAQFIRKPEDFILIIKILIAAAVILSLEGIAEYVFDYRLWVDKGRRASATFLDPNIFARFLDIAIITLLILRLKKIYIIKAYLMDVAMLICGITLFLTVSRQGVAILFATLFLISFFFRKNVRNGIIVSLLILVLLSIPIFLELLETREQGLMLYDIGTRRGLLLGGGLMFLSNPVTGIGAGGFQAVMIARFLDFLPWGIHSATLSHTHLMTVFAELGITGFLIFAVFLFFVYRQFRINFKTEDHLLKGLSLIALSGILIIFFGAQAEGRFFAEPLLWLFLGLNVSLDRLISGK
jgi:hypothetical protein